MNVLIVGATGVMGRALVRQLLKSGVQVTAMTRSSELAVSLNNMGAHAVRGDLIDPPTLAYACRGADAVVSAAHSLLGSGKYSSAAVDLKGQRDLIDAAKDAGVKNFVFTSILGARSDHPVDFLRYKAAAEQYLQASGMNYTILRASGFMEWHVHTFLGKDILEKGKTTILGKGEVPTNFIAAGDVAKYAVIALNDPRARNCILEIGGLDNRSKNQVAEMYVRLSGKQAKISHLPRAMLRVMSVLFKPLKPEVSRLMLLSYLNDTQDQSFDASKTLAEFPVDLVRLEDFVRARVAEWKASA